MSAIGGAIDGGLAKCKTMSIKDARALDATLAARFVGPAHAAELTALEAARKAFDDATARPDAAAAAGDPAPPVVAGAFRCQGQAFLLTSRSERFCQVKGMIRGIGDASSLTYSQTLNG